MKLVAVTTSPDRAAAAAIPFTLLGMQPVLLPCIEARPASPGRLEEARAAAAGADLVMISSRRTLDILWPDGPLPTVDFAVVGTATARAVGARGGNVAVTGDQGAARLVETLLPTLGDRAVFWPHAAGTNPATVATVARTARILEAPVVYTSIPVAPSEDPADVITFASPSAVAGWQLSRRLDGVIAVIGETTRQAVEAAGAQVTVVATTPTFQSLAESVAFHLGVPV